MLIKEFFALLGFKVDGKSENKFNTSLQNAKKGLLAVGAAATAVAAGVGVAVSRFTQRARELEQAAEISGIPIERLQELELAASSSRLELKDLTQAFGQFNENIVNAAKGTGSANEDFRTLGVRLRGPNAELRSTNDILLDVADSVATLGPSAERTAAVLGAFGEDDGRKLLPFLAKGRTGIEALTQKSREMGIVFDESTIAQSVRAGEAIQTFKNILSALSDTVAAEILPDIIEASRQFTAWFKANRLLIRQNIARFIRIVSMTAKVFLLILKVLSSTIQFVTNHLGLLAAILGGVLLSALLANLGTVLLMVGGYIALGVQAVAAGIAAAAAWALANLPFIALAALIAFLILIVEDLIVAFQGGDSVIGNLIAKATGLGDVLRNVKDAIFGVAKGFRDAAVSAAEFFGITFLDEDARLVVPDTTGIPAAILGADAVLSNSHQLIEESNSLPPGVSLQDAPFTPVFNAEIHVSQRDGESSEEFSERTVQKLQEFFTDRLREAQAGTVGN